MNNKPLILITNDDGISAPGIRYLVEVLSPVAHVVVVAPKMDQSAVGLGMTIRTPLYVEKVSHFEGLQAWSVTGTPVDCVKLGLSTLLEKTPDLIVSGINRGSNAGRGLLYSGTVAAAIEGVLKGIPAIAYSCIDFDAPNYAQASKYVVPLVEHMLAHPLPPETVLNVNCPNETIQGFKLTRQGKEYWIEDPVERKQPYDQQQNYYWLGAKLQQFDEAEDSDIVWLRKGYITAVPLHIGDFTHTKHLEAHREHFDKL